MSPVRGNPFLRVRLEPEVLRLIREQVPARVQGRSSGASDWVRGLIYRELGLGEPPRYAATPSARKSRTKVVERDGESM